MTRQLTANTTNLSSGATIAGKFNDVRVLKVMGGRVWVTVEGERRDFWLKANDTLPLLPNRLVVVQAEDGSAQVCAGVFDTAPARH